MNGRILGALLLGGVVCLAVLTCSPSHQPVNAQRGAKAQQWEYRVVFVIEAPWPWQDVIRAEQFKPGEGAKVAAKVGELYNKLGAGGWEYVGPHSDSKYGFVVFKRQKR